MRALTIAIMLLFSMQFLSAQSNYNASKKAFEAGKAAHNNSYEYSLKFASFLGYWYETTFTVKNGEVVARRFKSEHSNDNPKYNKSWEESAADLGSHKEEGHGVMTMDKVYEDAAQWAKKPKDAFRQHYFETKNDGIISMAGYTIKNCMDDCFKGYRVSAFKWL